MGAINSVNRLTVETLGLFEWLEPTADEVSQKEKLQRDILKSLRRVWSHCQIRIFGSSENGFALGSSDVDMCLILRVEDFSGEIGIREFQVQTLQKAIQILRKSKLGVSNFVSGARVPVVKLRDPKSGLSVDLSCNNPLATETNPAFLNTQLLSTYSTLDPRVRPLVLAVKFWAKQRGINDPANGTLSSYAYVLLVIHFLQSRSTPILPRLQPSADVDQEVPDSATFGHSGCATVGHLLKEFFRYYAVELELQRMVVSIRSTVPLSKDMKWQRWVAWRWSIEDPIDMTHDVGKVIFCRQGQRLIEDEFYRASSLLENEAGLQLVCSRTLRSDCYICQNPGHRPRKCPVFNGVHDDSPPVTPRCTHQSSQRSRPAIRLVKGSA